MNKNDYITKEYLDKTLDRRFTEFRVELSKEMKQYMKDLKTGFSQDLGIVIDQVKSLDEKVDRIGGRLVRVEYSLSNLEIDVREIKNIIPNYVEKKHFNELEKRVAVLEKLNS